MERKERDRQRKQTKENELQKFGKLQKIKGLNKNGNKTLQVKQRNKNI